MSLSLYSAAKEVVDRLQQDYLSAREKENMWLFSDMRDEKREHQLQDLNKLLQQLTKEINTAKETLDGIVDGLFDAEEICLYSSGDVDAALTFVASTGYKGSFRTSSQQVAEEAATSRKLDVKFHP